MRIALNKVLSQFKKIPYLARLLAGKPFGQAQQHDDGNIPNARFDTGGPFRHRASTRIFRFCNFRSRQQA